jgi:hypothetical protein
MNDDEQTKQLLADFRRLMQDLSQFLESAEAASKKREAMVNKLKEDHDAGKISWEHFDEMIEAAIQDEELQVTQIGQLRDELFKIKQLATENEP